MPNNLRSPPLRMLKQEQLAKLKRQKWLVRHPRYLYPTSIRAQVNQSLDQHKNQLQNRGNLMSAKRAKALRNENGTYYLYYFLQTYIYPNSNMINHF